MNTLTDHDYETIRRCAVTDRRYHTFVEVELGELIDNDLEGFLDLISTRAVGRTSLGALSISSAQVTTPSSLMSRVMFLPSSLCGRPVDEPTSHPHPQGLCLGVGAVPQLRRFRRGGQLMPEVP